MLISHVESILYSFYVKICGTNSQFYQNMYKNHIVSTNLREKSTKIKNSTSIGFNQLDIAIERSLIN